MRNALEFLLMYLAVSIVLGLMWAVQAYPDLPGGASEWLTIFALALPLQVLMGFVGERLWNNRATRLVEHATASSSFSPLRVACGVLLMLALSGLLFGAAYGWRMLQALVH